MKGMASSSAAFASSSLNIIQNSGLFVKPISRVRMLKPIKFSLKKSLPLQIRSSLKKKIYEDDSEGVICYEDENGEIICEGYDEGPRFQHPFPQKDNQRKAEKIDLLLRQSRIHLRKGGGEGGGGEELSHTNKGVKDLNANGFHSFC